MSDNSLAAKAAPDQDKEPKKHGSKEEDTSMEKQGFDIFKNLKLKLKKLHLRFEDDTFSVDNPFSFGFVIDVNAL